MITEDYVSIETAKLLKGKGFNEATNRYYNAQHDQIRTVSDIFMWHWNDEEFMKRVFMEGAIAIPTLQMAMKWLREVHKIEIWVQYDIDKTTWWGGCNPMYEEDEENSNMFQNLLGFDYPGKTYEEACEAAIKYCLENL